MAMKTWILIADREHARVLELSDPHKIPYGINIGNYVEAVNHELTKGEVSMSGSENESMTAGNAVLDSESGLRDLRSTISASLEQARLDGRFDRLVIVAPEQVLSDLMSSLTRAVRELVVIESSADLMNADATVIRASLPI